MEKKYPGEISIGECRRMELARALINSPPILVLDELTANLDDDNIWDIFQLLQEINHKGTTVIMATHASQYVNMLRQRVITMVDGHIFGDVQKGKYGDVM
jgi:cell division transport system ATP-binding protein